MTDINLLRLVSNTEIRINEIEVIDLIFLRLRWRGTALHQDINP